MDLFLIVGILAGVLWGFTNSETQVEDGESAGPVGALVGAGLASFGAALVIALIAGSYLFYLTVLPLATVGATIVGVCLAWAMSGD